MFIKRDFDHEDLDHYTKPKTKYKAIVVSLVTVIPAIGIILLLLFRRQVANIWVQIRHWTVGMPKPDNVLVGEPGGLPNTAEQARADGSSEKNVVMPFQDRNGGVHDTQPSRF
ncbi:hypothetical protein TWF970_009373 [Orbilia oligospora]|uniref:Uncharacterized protein n=1 Tax=Orbilia oligospora TaxID=2813651 RepID=A0A7C8R318_ORBOL|nr:hypothetical protein TWF970_009373 [Orbilia oligospora]